MVFDNSLAVAMKHMDRYKTTAAKASKLASGLKRILRRFARARRGTTVVVFALALLPLVLSVALAIDYTFLTETRSQIQLAADAAVTHAVRAAAATYSLELNQGITNSAASTDGISAGKTAGQDWFTAQLGALPTANIPATATNNSCTGGANPCVSVLALANNAGFSASVTYQANYPPFFDAWAGGPPGNTVFKTSATWYITGTSNAQAQYNYVEIMMLIDTSASMLIGATPTDIALLEKYDVCPPTNRVTTVAGDNDLYIASRPDLVDGTNSKNGRSYQYRSVSTSSPTSYGATTSQYDDSVDFTKVASTGHFTDPSNTADDSSGSCNAAGGYVQPAFVDSVNNPGGAGVPCGFACHITNNTYQGYDTDLYGFARYIGVAQESNGVLGIRLRLDYVLSATEQIITSMISNEQASDEFSIGVYQFNTALANNVTDLGTGTQGTPGDAAGDTSYEATYDLTDALAAVKKVDYQVTPSETALPSLVSSADGNTNFTTAVTNFAAGKATSGNALAAVTTANNSKSNPQKDVFIVTDGLEDECGTSCGSTRVMGEMTSVATEVPAGGLSAATGSCAKFKKLGYNVYVLYIDYYPVPHYTYYVTNVSDPSATSPSDSFINNDYASITDGSIQQMTTPASTNNVTASVTGTYGKWGALSFPDDSPTEAALRACASVNPNGSTADPTYFFEATNAAAIATQLNTMLETALGSAIRVTN
jgi:Flp pilus assembly protein TadG